MIWFLPQGGGDCCAPGPARALPSRRSGDEPCQGAHAVPGGGPCRTAVEPVRRMRFGQATMIRPDVMASLRGNTRSARPTRAGAAASPHWPPRRCVGEAVPVGAPARDDGARASGVPARTGGPVQRDLFAERVRAASAISSALRWPCRRAWRYAQPAVHRCPLPGKEARTHAGQWPACPPAFPHGGMQVQPPSPSRPQRRYPSPNRHSDGRPPICVAPSRLPGGTFPR